MPTIRSRKYPDHIHYVTVEDWQVFQDKGLDRRYVVIDDKDIQDTVIETPHSFEVTNVQDLSNEVGDIDSITKEVIKAWLTEHSIEYDSKAKKDELYQLYIDNQNL